jgi:ABC-2 type transport system ATP-binding protein
MPTNERREVIAIEKLAMRYGRIAALDDVNLTLGGPQVIGILGPNGAGKTTLLEILEGLKDPSEGSVRLFQERLDRRRYPRQRVGAVLQREPVLDSITVREYAELFAALYHVRDGGAAIVKSAMLEHRAGIGVERLSGGESQRLFIAAASVHDPELLFLDEPTSHLDPENRARIDALIAEMGKRRTVLLCTHDLDEAEKICDTVVFLVGGHVKAVGPCAELVASVPDTAWRDKGRPRRLEDAFFHYCAAVLSPEGNLR